MPAVTNPAIAVCLALTRAMSNSRTVEDIYEVALNALADGLGVARASILLFDADGVMRFKAHRRLSDTYRRQVEGHSPWTPDSSDPQPIVVSDITREPSLSAYLPVIQAEGIAAMAFIPLVNLDRVIGKFMLYYESPYGLSDEELQLAGLIAAQVAFAVGWKRAEDHARRSEAAVQEASRLKDEFLATLSHELRTPLNAILGWVQMAQSGRTTAEQLPRAIDVIGRNAKLQAQLIEDVLDVSRIITEKLDIQRVPVLITELIDTVIAGTQPAADAKGIVLVKRFAADVPPIDGDPKRLHQVLGNVLSNAVKYTPAGGSVEIRCRLDGDAVVIEVQDSGIGIEPAFLPYVFERFRQGDSGSTRRHGGLGLGLAIARHLVEQHRGEIRADSQGTGRGTLVTIRLPVGAGAPTRRTLAGANLEHASTPELALRGTRVMVVDDQLDSRDVLAAFFTHHGAAVTPCDSAAAALATLRVRPIELIVADLAMPDMDGYELIREVRRLYSDLPAVAVSAYARLEDRGNALRSGYNAYCAKPVELADLLQAVRQALRQ